MSELLGEYRHKMDAKGRLSLPSSFRKVLSQDLRITPDPENQCLYVFEVDDYSNWVEGLFEGEGGFDVSSKRKSALRKVLNSRVRNCEIDNSAASTLPPLSERSPGWTKTWCSSVMKIILRSGTRSVGMISSALSIWHR